MGHGEFDAQAETVATPGDKRAKLTHCHSDNTTTSEGQAIPSHSVPSGTTVLPAAAIGSDGSICQPRIRVNDGATEPKSSENTADVVVSLSEDTPSSSSSSIGTSALIAASARVSGPSQTASTVASQNAKCLTINAYVNSKFSRIRINIDLGTVSSVAADTRFKNDHAVFPRALNTSRSRYGALQGRWEFEIACNELAWRLAWLNKGRLRGRKPLIQKCLDAYRIRFSTPPWNLLSCYRDQMSESVDPQFFDYWTPRPGRLRLNAEPATSTQSPQEQVSVASSHYDSIIPPSHSTLSSGCLENSAGAMLSSSSNAPGSCATTKSSKVALRDATMLESEAVEQPRVSGSTAVADENTASRLEPTSQHCLEPDVAGNAMAEPLKRSSSSSGSESAARMRIIRPKSGSGQATDIAQVVPVVLRPVGVPSIPAAPITGLVRPIVRPQSTLSVIAPAPGSQTRPLDSQPPAASRPVASSNTSVVGSMPSLSHSRPRPPPARSQAFVPKRSNVPAANVGNRPPTQPPMPTLQQISPNGRGVRPTTVLSTGESVAIPAPNQHSRPSQKLPASQLAVSPRPAPAKVVTGAKTPLPPRASANMQRDPRRRPAAASGEGLPQRSVTAPTSPPVVRRRHTDAPGSLVKLQPGRSSTSHPPVSSSIGPVTIGDAGAGTNRSSPSARIQATTKAHAQSSKGNMVIPPTAHGSGSEKSVKAQVAADMLTDVLRRLAKTDPSLAPLAGVLGKSQLELKSNKTCPAPRGDDDDGDDDDAPLDDKVAELEKLIIDLQNN
ncbi:hypothetical protein GGI24_001274 [Coemansia furcata]|nr:hypothetical protein GGI24_001274 [Coemansia furcata]